MRLFQYAVVPTLLALVSCVDAPDQLGESTQSVVVDNKIAFNRIAFNRIAFNRIAFNRIAFNRIAFNRLELNVDSIGDLLNDPDDQELLSFVIGCALPEGMSLVAPDPQNPGETIEFFGEVGLAPRWVDRSLDRKGRRWVSACLLARVNNNNVTVAVSMRGGSDALASDASERATYTLEEGAFFGDVFGPLDAPLRAYACRGRDQAVGNAGALAVRDCAEPDPAHPGFSMCGMTYAGDCVGAAPRSGRGACKNFEDDGYYDECKAAVSKKAAVAAEYDANDEHYETSYESNTFHEVITTFVQ